MLSLPGGPSSPRRAWTAAVGVAFVPVAVWLAVQAQRSRAFLVLPDELIYAEHAQSLASRPLAGLEVYGLDSGFTNGVYPALLAPLYALFGTPAAFTGAHILNGVLFASAAIPVVLLLRHLGAVPWLAALAGILATCVPWAASTAVLMTEAAAYPAFAWAVFAMTVAVSDPRPRHDALALVAILVGAGVRTQFFLLLAVLVVAILVHAATSVRDAATPLRHVLRGRLRPHVPLAIILSVLALLALAVGPGVLGPYGGTANDARLPEGLITIATRYLGHLATGVTIVPMVMGLAFFVHALTRPADPRHYAFALVGALSALLVLYQAAVFSHNVAGPWLHERYVAYTVIPLTVAAVALLAEARRPPPLGAVLAAGGAVAVLASVLSFDREVPLPAWTVLAPSQGLNEVWSGRLERLNDLVPGGPHDPAELLALAVLVLTLVVGALLTARRRGVVAAAALVVVLMFNVYATDRSIGRASGAANDNVDVNAPPDRNWVDVAAGDRRVAVIPGPLGGEHDRSEWVGIQFWNTSVQRLYEPASGGLNFGLPARTLSPDLETGVLTEPIDAPLAVLSPNDPNLGIAGSVVARRRSGVALVELEEPQRLTRLLLRADPRGETRPGVDAELRLYAPPDGAAVQITLEAPPSEDPTRWEVRSRGIVRGGRLSPSGSVTTRLPITAPSGAPHVRVTIHTPDSYASPDGREIGVRIASIAVV